MDSETPLTTTHKFYVIISEGVRGLVTITANEDGEVVSSTNASLLSPINTRPHLPQASPQHGSMAGIRKVKNEDGTVTVVPSEKVKSDIRLFVETTPCWFPECEALRAAYNTELASLPEGCPSCEKGALIRKYLKKMETINTDAT